MEDTSQCEDSPLIIALKNKATSEIVTTLIAAHPDAVKEADRHGTPCLIVALWNDAPLEVVTAMIGACPDAVKQEDANGKTALHVALQYSTGIADAIPFALIAAYPDAIKKKNTFGEYPLHMLNHNATPELLNALITPYPDALKLKSNDGDTPLHKVLQKNVTSELLTAMMTAYPDAIKKKNKNGNTPLHMAMRGNATPPEIVTALMTAYPDALKMKNKDGNTPLHMALHFARHFGALVVTALIAAYPDALKLKNKRGNTPLHVAAIDATPVTLAALIAVYPGAAMVKNKKKSWIGQNSGGQTPLHIALKRKVTPDAETLAMIAACPDAVKQEDANGKFPLDYVLEGAETPASAWFGRSGTVPATRYQPLVSIEVANALVVAWPDSVLLKDDVNGETGLHCALLKNVPEAIVITMIAQCPDVVRETCNAGNTALHIALKKTPCAVECRCLRKPYTELLLATLLAACPVAATKTDSNGCTPLTLALQHLAPNAVVRQLIVHFPAALEMTTPAITHWTQFWMNKEGGGDTVFHTLAGSHFPTIADARNANAVCFTLAERHSSKMTRNVILNMIPRHELRQGGCEPAEEQAARAQYLSILQHARTAIDAKEAAVGGK
eukprot:gene14878-biopygen26151